jgi:hypothetical protein
MQNVFRIFCTQSDHLLHGFLESLSQQDLVQLDHVTVPVEGLDHMLALAVEDEERELISEPLYHFISLGHLVMFCDQVRILHVSGNGMHIA